MKRLHIVFLFLSVLLTACSNVGEGERLLVVKVVEQDTISADTVAIDTMDYFMFVPRNVLIEDFTGQNCLNCPNATDLIALLQEMNGHDRIVAVGIHSGPLGVKSTDNAEGLATELGDTYYNYWQIEMQPYGVIDRSDGILSTDWWTAKVNWDLSPEQPLPGVNIWVKAKNNEGRATIDVTLAAKESVGGMMQLWIVEDGIVAFQKMPDGTMKKDYIHNHVLRDAVNGTWGEEVAVETDDLQTFSYSYDIPETWNADNLSVVAFVYNADGVVQAVREPIKESY